MMFNTKKLPDLKKTIQVETPKSINVPKPPPLEKEQIEALNSMNPEFVKAYAFLNKQTVPKEQRDRFLKILKARVGLLDFITFTKPDYEVNWHHELLCDEIDDFLEDPDVNRLMIFIGPRRGKSEIVSRRLPAYVFGKNPDIKIIATSYGAELASSMNRDVQRIIDSEVYREVFPNTCLSGRNVKTSAKGSYVRTSDKFQIVGHQGEYRSAGVAGAITGAGADLCGKFDTPVLTKNGYRAINTLSVGDLVWSFNHGTKKLELKRVTNILRRRTSETVTTTFSSGRKSVFTPDHPFYTTQHEYVEAQFITKESELIQETISKNNDVRLLTVMQLLSCHFHEIVHRVREESKGWGRKLLLLSGMLQENSEAKDGNLQKTQLSKYRDGSEGSYLWDVQNGEKELSYKENKAYAIFSCCKPVNKVSRQLQMCALRIKDILTRSPYRRGQLERQTRKHGNTLQGLSHTASHGTYRFVDGAEVERNRDELITVYDITVEDNHNFFANGILVHNCIIDDPLKDWKEALSNTVKQGVYDWYTSTLSTRLSPNGKVIILLTRWAEDDLAGRLLDDMKKNDKADKWKVISLPEQFDSDNEHTHPLDQREDGEYIWPDRFTPESMETRKASVGSKVWSALYQQQPSPGDGTIFKASWFQYYKELPQFTRVTISVDCAFSDTEKSDFVCITVWGVNGANKYLLHLVNERLDFPATCREIANTKAMFPHANRIIVENKANGPAVISTLKSKISGIIPYNPTESKVARATAVSPQFEAGNVFLPEALYEKNRIERPWCTSTLNTFIAQFKAFPWGRHDDMVDSAVQFLINEANVPQWLKSVENLEKTPKSAEQTSIEELANTMGWGKIKKESQEVRYYNNHNR